MSEFYDAIVGQAGDKLAFLLECDEKETDEMCDDVGVKKMQNTYIHTLPG